MVRQMDRHNGQTQSDIQLEIQMNGQVMDIIQIEIQVIY